MHNFKMERKLCVPDPPVNFAPKLNYGLHLKSVFKLDKNTLNLGIEQKLAIF